MLTIGLLVNPYAGIGGPVGLKGSDGAEVRDEALRRGARPRAVERAHRALALLEGAEVEIFCWEGAMGSDALAGLELSWQSCGRPDTELTTAADTARAAQAIAARQPDVLVFAGGDGTARDILDAVGDRVAALGIPSGVKMHSAVYAVSPEAAGELLKRLAAAGLVNVELREVRDIDEDAFRKGVVKTRFYGELLTPEEGHFLQRTKVAGVESEALVAEDIAADIVESIQPGRIYLIGPGSTTAAIMAELGLPNTLLGVDAICDGEVLLSDAGEPELLALLEGTDRRAEIIVTAIGGQGHVFGRGNQQFSPAVLRKVGLDNITIVAGKGKIKALNGEPLLVDTNDPALDLELCGYRKVVTGYHDAILYPVATLPGLED
ncbi:MAG: ATP-NAD kinase family protein [Halieaceae bacterium]|jgi:predicted polyphosphate/ATP-dependent NAD kinase|nr:ATP-NAD kinase family protein [Halieaceae bacterium]